MRGWGCTRSLQVRSYLFPLYLRKKNVPFYLQVVHSASMKHISSQQVKRLIWDPLIGISISVCLLFIASDIHFNHLASKLKFGGQVALMVQYCSIGWNGWLGCRQDCQGVGIGTWCCFWWISAMRYNPYSQKWRHRPHHASNVNGCLEAYLTEIAKGYGVKWTPHSFSAEAEVPKSGPSKVSSAFFIWTSFNLLHLP